MRYTLLQRPRHMAKEGTEALTERKWNIYILLYRYLWDRLSSPPKKETLILCATVSSSLVKALLSYAYICMRLDCQISWCKDEAQYIGVYRKCGVANYTWSKIGPTSHIKILKNESLPQWIEPHAINCHMSTCWHVPSKFCQQKIKTRDVGASWRLVSWEATLGRKNTVGVTKYDQELQPHPYIHVDLTQ